MKLTELRNLGREEKESRQENKRKEREGDRMGEVGKWEEKQEKRKGAEIYGKWNCRVEIRAKWQEQKETSHFLFSRHHCNFGRTSFKVYHFPQRILWLTYNFISCTWAALKALESALHLRALPCGVIISMTNKIFPRKQNRESNYNICNTVRNSGSRSIPRLRDFLLFQIPTLELPKGPIFELRTKH